ncbi:MAG: 5-methyltetrahydropteroyltriglutamate--homocysteine S-methyltransferase [Proteobacteria bacterium]|nr:5-methyltetrahydropteroyltriglutamate--homocysteine S-methyltransferase [Pseudomonadota bacterium]
MATNGKPFFRADHVGSLLRPQSLLDARGKWKAGEISRDALRQEEDAGIRDAIKLQEDVGLKAITDGEFRRENWWIDYISQVGGIAISEPDRDAEFQTGSGGSGYIPKHVLTTGKIHRTGRLMEDDYNFIASGTRQTPKVTIPSPTRMHFHGGRKAVDKGAYPDMEAFWNDIATLYQDEIASLEDLGCRYIQIDDPILSYFVDDRMLGLLERIGENPKTLIHKYVEVLNACIEKRRPDTQLSMHICRGNAASSWMVSGGYGAIAEALFPHLDFDTYFLEYDDERSGDFQPLSLVPKGKNVVLGLLTSKFSALETADDLKRRIDDAAKYMEMDNLALSPQCGFASIDTGNLVTLDDQIRKLSLVVETAEQVWGNR